MCSSFLDFIKFCVILGTLSCLSVVHFLYVVSYLIWLHHKVKKLIGEEKDLLNKVEEYDKEILMPAIWSPPSSFKVVNSSGKGPTSVHYTISIHESVLVYMCIYMWRYVMSYLL